MSTEKKLLALVAASATATVRDNRFTFKNADDMGRADPVPFTDDAAATLLGQFAEECTRHLRAYSKSAAEYFVPALEAALHNHWLLTHHYSALDEGPSAYAACIQQILLEGAVATAILPHPSARFPAQHECLRLLAAEHEQLMVALKQAFQQALGDEDSTWSAAIAMQSALYTLCCAYGCALRVPSPEAWPCPPGVWKPVRAQMASVEKRGVSSPGGRLQPRGRLQ